jgi:hypothetical protein
MDVRTRPRPSVKPSDHHLAGRDSDRPETRSVQSRGESINRVFFVYAIIKVRNSFGATVPLKKFGRLQRHCFKLFFFALHATTARLGFNGVKVQV